MNGSSFARDDSCPQIDGVKCAAACFATEVLRSTLAVFSQALRRFFRSGFERKLCERLRLGAAAFSAEAFFFVGFGHNDKRRHEVGAETEA